MSLKTLSEKLSDFRCERPSEWLMDEYIRDACKLEAEIDRLNAQVAMLHEALDALMQLESRGRVMPIGKEWDAARLARRQSESDWLAKHDAEVRKAAESAVLAEHVGDNIYDENCCPEDIAYNAALKHAATAIRSL